MNDRPQNLTLALAIAGSVGAVSTAAIFIRYVDESTPPLAIAFYRLLYATVLLAPFAWWHARDELKRLKLRDLAGLFGVGAVLALHFAAWISSLDLTSVASSVFLVTLHPAFVGLVSWRVYQEGLTKRGWIGVGVALAGGAIITAGDATTGTNPLIGDILALIGAAAAAIYFLAGRGYRRRLGLLAYVTPVYAASTLVLGVLLVATPAPWGGALGGYGWTDHAFFLALALVPMILGHTVLNWALKYVTAPVIATTILGEPVGSTILAVIFLGESPPLAVWPGGALVLGGIAAVALTGRRGAPRAQPAPLPPPAEGPEQG